MIMDITGTDSLLWARCPIYLKKDGFFAMAGAISATHVNVAPGIIGSLAFMARDIRQVASWQMNMMWPVALGGVPRKSFFHSGTPTAKRLELVRQLVEDRKMKGVIDSVWEMDDALKVRANLEHLIYGILRPHQHTC